MTIDVHLLAVMLCQAYHRVLCWAHYCSCLIYVNGLQEIPSAGTKFVLYADDILVYKTTSSLDDHHLFQCDVNAITSWLVQNSMTLDTAKCKYMSVSRKSSSLASRLQLSPTLYWLTLYHYGRSLDQIFGNTYILWLVLVSPHSASHTCKWSPVYSWPSNHSWS